MLVVRSSLGATRAPVSRGARGCRRARRRGGSPCPSAAIGDRPAGEVAGVGERRSRRPRADRASARVAKLAVEGPGDLLGRLPEALARSRRWAMGRAPGRTPRPTWAAVQMRLPPLRLARYWAASAARRSFEGVAVWRPAVATRRRPRRRRGSRRRSAAAGRSRRARRSSGVRATARPRPASRAGRRTRRRRSGRRTSPGSRPPRRSAPPPTLRSASSPAACPRMSLIAFSSVDVAEQERELRSRRRRSGRWRARAAPRAARRLARPVSASS